MEEISRIKKLEVAQYYILVYPYSDRENRASVSRGSVVNIVKELGDGKLTIASTAFDQVNDLRQLSLDLKKKGLVLDISYHTGNYYHQLSLTPDNRLA